MVNQQDIPVQLYCTVLYFRTDNVRFVPQPSSVKYVRLCQDTGGVHPK